jgi:hypothetical protein
MMSDQWVELRRDLDEMAQTLFGALAALDAHLRRLRRPEAPSSQELRFAIEHIRDVQRRLSDVVQHHP